MKKLDWFRHGKLMLLSAAVYFLLDLPVQLTGFLSFGSYIGIKNFLPTTLGLQFGPAGIVGSWVGCLASAAILRSPASETALECVTILIMGLGTWILWHLGSSTHRIHFKRFINYFKYFGILTGLSSVSGCVGLLLVKGSFLPTLIAYTALGLLVGIPVNILANGLFCFESILPPPYRLQYPVSAVVTADPESLMALNDQLEEFAFSNKLNRRRLFEVQNCLEELTIRILAQIPDASIRVDVHYDDTLSARLHYEGVRCNPLRTQKDEDELDVMGLKLVKHRALRAAYDYHSRCNHIHVVM